ncbi:MAG: hypothetical protein ACYSWQ_00340 [Planctomycetota bacterium]|jgi:hypothetical protein
MRKEPHIAAKAAISPFRHIVKNNDAKSSAIPAVAEWVFGRSLMNTGMVDSIRQEATNGWPIMPAVAY